MRAGRCVEGALTEGACRADVDIAETPVAVGSAIAMEELQCHADFRLGETDGDADPRTCDQAEASRVVTGIPSPDRGIEAAWAISDRVLKRGIAPP